MLAADLARSTANPGWGDNRDLLWQGFAMRGFGDHQNTASLGDADPVPDFSSPLANNATLNFSADAKGRDTGVPVNAKIYVGDYEARATQIADTNPATIALGTNATGNLDNTAQFAPTAPGSLVPKGDRWSTYNFTAVAPGYGFVRFKVKNLQPGETRNVTIHFSPNYASSTLGATVTGDTLGTNTSLGNLIDDTESTNDSQTGAPVAGRWVVVALGTAKPVHIDRLGVSALLTPAIPMVKAADNRFTALRSFEAYACTAGNAANPSCDGSIDAGWAKIVQSPDDAFPSINPRPVAPDMTLRYFDATAVPPVTHVKFVVDTNQCTGQSSYHGDQDQDSTSNSDCASFVPNPPAVPRGTEVHVSELEVFGSKGSVDQTVVVGG
jgi:hypothetical protein